MSIVKISATCPECNKDLVMELESSEEVPAVDLRILNDTIWFCRGCNLKFYLAEIELMEAV